MTPDDTGLTRLPVDVYDSGRSDHEWRRARCSVPREHLVGASGSDAGVARIVAGVAALLARVLAEDAVAFAVTARVISALQPPPGPLDTALRLLRVPVARSALLADIDACVLAAVDAALRQPGDGTAAFPPVVLDLAVAEASTAASVLCAEQLQLTIVPSGLSVQVLADYDSGCLDDATVARLLDCLQRLLAQAAEAPTTPLGRLPLLSVTEHERIVFGLNQTAVPRDYTQQVHERFAAQAVRSPDAIALESDARTLTYRELNALAENLAAELVRRGVGPETLVGLCMTRSIAMVVSILAILKADGAFVPLDPELPASRLAYMLRDTAASLVLVDADAEALIAEIAPHVARLDVASVTGAVAKPERPPASRAGPSNLAYVIYTSGSTGQPKGVLITHAGLSNHAQWYAATLGITPADRMLLHASIGFDAAMAEIFPPLLSGATIVLAAPDAHIELRELPLTVVRHGVTLMQLVPSALRVALTSPAFASCATLRFLVCGGEALDAPLCRSVQRVLPLVRIGNFYGPSESTIDATSFPRIDVAHASGPIPIGSPIANVVCHVLDPDGVPVPIGFFGELHVGGVALARGYLNQPELTAARFVADPFRPGHRLYRTGDRARYRTDGTLEFGGRIDSQVKVRGFRIELAEVERAMQGLPTVEQVAVIVRDDRDGDAQLVAYVVPTPGATPDAPAMRRALEDALPAWMIPSGIVMLHELPLTANGKLDVRALPAPGQRESAGGADAAFGDALEVSLASIWRHTLGLEGVQRDDDFFHLGGHSLKVFRILAEVERIHGVTLRASALFGAPTIRTLADLIRPSLDRDVFVL